MNVSTIISTARLNSHIISDQLSDADAVGFLNMIYQDMAASIISDVGEDFFFQTWTRDAIVDQTNGEYPYPVSNGSAGGMLRLKKICLKMISDSTEYTATREVDLSTLSRDWEWYLTNQPISDPIYFVADESIFIAPNFTNDRIQNGVGQIKLHGIQRLVDLASTDSESDIKIPVEYHWILSLGMEQWIYRSRGKFDESRQSRSNYDHAKKDMIEKLNHKKPSGCLI